MNDQLEEARSKFSRQIGKHKGRLDGQSWYANCLVFLLCLRGYGISDARGMISCRESVVRRDSEKQCDLNSKLRCMPESDSVLSGGRGRAERKKGLSWPHAWLELLLLNVAVCTCALVLACASCSLHAKVIGACM